MNFFHWDRQTVRRNSILALLLVVFVLGVHEILGSHGYLALRRQKRDYQALQQQIQKLQRDNQQLEKNIQSLKTDPDTIEKQAREQLHLVKPGEIIYTLPGKSAAQPPATAQRISPK